MEIKELINNNQHLFALNNIEKIIKKNLSEFIQAANSTDFEHRQLAKKIQLYIKNATNGNLLDRLNFKEYLKAKFLTDLNIYDINSEKQELIFNMAVEKNREVIEWIIPFSKSDLLTTKDKFEILLYKYKEINADGYDKAFKSFSSKYTYKKVNQLNATYQSNNIYYQYTKQDINQIYDKENIQLDFNEKVDILIQRFYEDIYGLGCIDILSYSDLNEIGISKNGQFIYCWSENKIHLPFLKLTEDETRLIQERAISFDEKAGQLCITKPEVLCYRADNARITAFQQPYSSTRELCIRIFNKQNNNFSDIIKNSNQQLLIQAIIKTGLKISLQGGLGAGKTTGMQVMFEVMDDSIHIGTVEDYFEQHNSLKYDNKRVVELQIVENKSLLDCVKSLFRASVDVASVGEARDGEAVFAFIQLAQALNFSTMFTSHIASPEDTVPRLKNMIISTGKYTNEQAAVMDIVNYVNIIFQHVNVAGKRYISDIVEIVPFTEKFSELNINSMDISSLKKLALVQQIQQNTSYMYTLNPLMCFENGDFVFKNYPSQRTIKKAKENEDSWSVMKKLLELMHNNLGGGEILEYIK